VVLDDPSAEGALEIVGVDLVGAEEDGAVTSDSAASG
jgi:hypothetical protein